MRSNPRIIITGSAGTGKTTLARALQRETGAPVIEEAMRQALQGGLDIHSLGGEGHRKLLRAHADAWAAQRLAHDDTGFVSDRSALDFAAFWLSNGYGVDDPHGYDELLRVAVAAAARSDLVVILPWGLFPIEADGVRYPNRWHQFHQQAVLEAVYRMAFDDGGDAALLYPGLRRPRLLWMPPDADDPATRCRRVMESLG